VTAPRLIRAALFDLDGTLVDSEGHTDEAIPYEPTSGVEYLMNKTELIDAVAASTGRPGRCPAARRPG